MPHTLNQCARLVVVIALIVGCAPTIESQWKKAQSTNTAQAYKDFLAKYPESKFLEEILVKTNAQKVWKEGVDFLIADLSFGPREPRIASVNSIAWPEKDVLKQKIWKEEESARALLTSLMMTTNFYGNYMTVDTLSYGRGSRVVFSSGRLYIYDSKGWWEIP